MLFWTKRCLNNLVWVYIDQNFGPHATICSLLADLASVFIPIPIEINIFSQVPSILLKPSSMSPGSQLVTMIGFPIMNGNPPSRAQSRLGAEKQSMKQSCPAIVCSTALLVSSNTYWGSEMWFNDYVSAWELLTSSAHWHFPPLVLGLEHNIILYLDIQLTRHNVAHTAETLFKGFALNQESNQWCQGMHLGTKPILKPCLIVFLKLHEI